MMNFKKEVGFIVSVLLLIVFITNSYAQAIYFMVSGNSMYPTYKNGDIVKVSESDKYNDGDVVVADVNGKKVIKRINGETLVGDNQRESVKYDLKSADILGKVEYNTDSLTDNQKKEFEKVFAAGIEMICAGNAQTLVLRSDGTVWGWGNNNKGQLGDNTFSDKSTPIQVVGVGGSGTLQNIKFIALKYQTAYAVMSDNRVCSWGDSGYGQLGDGSTTYSKFPVMVKGVGGSGTLGAISKVYAGKWFVLAVTTDQKIYAWGDNSKGQLGDNAAESYSLYPIQVRGENNSGNLLNIVEAGAGWTSSFAITSTGGIYSWGDNTSGALGDNTTTQRNTPVQVHGISNSGMLAGVSKVTGGRWSAVALKTDGTVVAWGEGVDGECGNGANSTTYTPVQVIDSTNAVLDNVIEISSDMYHIIALKSDGTVWTWGYNDQGQLGNNSLTGQNKATQIITVGFDNIIKVSAGEAHMAAIKSDGTVFGWGYNNYYNVGTGSATPIRILTPVNTVGVGGTGLFYAIPDVTPPTVTITSNPTSPTNTSTVTYTFTWNEAVTGFTASDITVANGTRKDATFTTTDTSHYTIQVDKVANGNQDISVAGSACQDGVENNSTASSIYTVVMTSIITSAGYSLGTVESDRKWFKYYLGKDANGATRTMLVAPRAGVGIDAVKQGTFAENEILNGSNQFISGSIYYIDINGRIQAY